MRIIITGSSRGIGKSVSEYFLDKGFEVFGIDLLESSINHEKYRHFVGDISKIDQLPDIGDVDYIFNNAGLQNSKDDITNNLKGAINVTEKYAFQNHIKSVLFNASASATSGFEFPEYAASKAGLLGYMKNVATRIAKYQATCNSLSLGGVLTESNKEIIDNKELWEKVMSVTPLKKWMDLNEVNEWVYFLLVTNKSMTGEDIFIDNGEYKLNNTFVWPK